MDRDGDHAAMPKTLTLTVAEAGKALGISRGAAYQAAERGELPTIRIGRRLLVPRAALLKMLEGAGEKAAGSPAAA